MYISSRVHHKESCVKVVEFMYHHVFITKKVLLKLRHVYIITCQSQGKLFVRSGKCTSQEKFFESCRISTLSSSFHHKESLFLNWELDHF